MTTVDNLMSTTMALMIIGFGQLAFGFGDYPDSRVCRWLGGLLLLGAVGTLVAATVVSSGLPDA